MNGRQFVFYVKKQLEKHTKNIKNPVKLYDDEIKIRAKEPRHLLVDQTGRPVNPQPPESKEKIERENKEYLRLKRNKKYGGYDLIYQPFQGVFINIDCVLTNEKEMSITSNKLSSFNKFSNVYCIGVCRNAKLKKIVFIPAKVLLSYLTKASPVFMTKNKIKYRKLNTKILLNEKFRTAHYSFETFINNNSFVALIMATRGDKKIIKYLKNNKFDLDKIRIAGSTIPHHMAAYGMFEVLKHKEWNKFLDEQNNTPSDLLWKDGFIKKNQLRFYNKMLKQKR